MVIARTLNFRSRRSITPGRLRIQEITTPTVSQLLGGAAPNFPPVSETFPITLIRPINFQQLSSYSSNGVLHFRYTWQSTSRNLKDLDQCMVGEYVTYPAPLETSYNWPSPPYKPYSNPNPVIAWSPATKVPSPDVHRYGNGFIYAV